jgi:tetratricopeptide (TPR) repeat protein
MFRLEDAIAERLVRSLIPELTTDENRTLARRYTDHPEAYQLYMIGRYHWSKANTEAWRKAIECFSRALEKDPNYALAYTGLADVYVSLAADDLPQTVAMPRAKEAAFKALAIDPSLSQVYISVGRIKQLYDWDWAGAEHDFRSAIESSPNSADAHREYGAYLASMGRFQEGISELKLAQQIDPVSNLSNFQVAWALLGARRHDEAIVEFRKLLDMDPNYAAAHTFLGQAYERKGMYDDAISELRTAMKLLRGGFDQGCSCACLRSCGPKNRSSRHSQGIGGRIENQRKR